MNPFYKLIASIIKEAEPFSGHASFRVVDNDAVGTDPIREISLDAVPLSGDDVMVTLSWEGGVKEFEKTMPSEEANHTFQLISTDLSQVVSLSTDEKFDEAKEAMKNILKTYAETTDTPVSTTAPKLNTTQASDEFNGLWKKATVTMKNVFQTLKFDSPEELMEYQEKMKSSTKPDQDTIPLWEQNEKSPEDKTNLAPPSMSYEDMEKNKEKDTKNLDKRIHEQVKTELESALEEKKATMFTDNDKKLVDGMRAVGRNWDEIKKYMVKELAYDKESVDMYIDDMRSHEDGVEPMPEDTNPLTPPTDLVSPETHEKLLQDIEEKKSKPPVEEPIKEESAQKCPECGEMLEYGRHSMNGIQPCRLMDDKTADKHVHEWKRSKPTATVDTCYCGRFKHNENNKNPIIEEVTESSFTPQDIMAISELDEISRADNDDIRKVALQLWKYPSNYMGDDLSDYYKGPAKGYDADALDKSNFKVALEMLGGEGNGVLVGSFGGFGGGHEQIFVHKDATDKVAILQDIENKLTKYPVLDDSDYSEEQMQEEQESYESWAKGDALKIIDQELHRQNPDLQNSITELELSPELENKLAMIVYEALSYGDGTALDPKHLIEEADREGLLNDFRNTLGGKKVIPENPAQMKLFESSLRSKLVKNALKKRAADDLNPLQEPIKEEPTMGTGQDVLPMGKPQSDHKAPSAGDWVMVKSDLKNELPAFKAKFVSDYLSDNGTEYATVETENQELIEVEMYRVTKITDSKPAAQEAEPISEPQIEMPQEAPIAVTPSTEKLTSMSSVKQADSICSDTSGTSHAGPMIKHQHGIDSTMYCEKHLPSHIKYNKPEPKTAEKHTKCVKCDKSLPVKDMIGNVHGAGYLCKEDASEWNKDSSLKQADEDADERRFERAIDVLDKQFSRHELSEDQYDAAYAKLKKEIFPNEGMYADFLSTKSEAILKEVQGMGKTSYMFVKKGLEKHADDSAFEGNGWCRVWVQEDEVASSSKYAEILKLPDENARIAALKEVARDLAHEALHLADNSASKVGVQSWFESLKPSDHDRIDWVSLANPQVTESSLEHKVEKEAAGVEDIMRGQAGPRQIGKVWIKDNFDGEVMSYSSHFADKAEFDRWVASKIEGSTTKEILKSEFPVAKKVASDFEKGISQNKTADPEVAPKTQFKDYKITPKYAPKEQALPATPELDAVLTKMDSLQQNLATLEAARKQIQAKMQEEMARVDQSGERVQMEAALQESVEKAAVLIEAVESKVVQWKDKLYTLQTEEVSYVPKLTPKEMLEKIYHKFSGAEKYVQDVLNGMLSQAEKVMEKTLIQWPNKKSSLGKEASLLDVINQMNEELLAALKELSSPL